MENIPVMFAEAQQLPEPPETFSVYLKSLWYDRKGQWDKAHNLIDQLDGREAARLHAYLHRKEGDESNASYWYRRAGAEKPDLTLHEEQELLIRHFVRQA